MPRCPRDLLAFMTRLPLGGGSLEGAAWCIHLAPLAGLLVGAAALAPLEALGLAGAPAILAGSLYPAIHYILTGGLHLDGLADYADVWGSGARGEAAARILKDPRRGAHAIAALAAATIASAGAAASIYPLNPIDALAVFTAAYAAAYESMFLALLAGPPEPYRGMALPFSKAARKTRWANAALYASLAAALTVTTLAYSRGLAASIAILMALAPAVGVLVALDARSRLGFVNGDVAGAAFEVSRVVALAAAAALVGSSPS